MHFTCAQHLVNMYNTSHTPVRCGAIAEGGGTCTPHIWGPRDDNPPKMVDDHYSSHRLPYTGRYSAEREFLFMLLDIKESYLFYRTAL